MFIFLMNLAGGSGVLLLHRFRMHQRIEKIIHENSQAEILVTFHFTKEEAASLNWFEEDREFRLEGNMYDIVKAEDCGDSVIYLCVNDTRETEIFRHIERDLENRKGDRNDEKNFATQLFNFFSHLYCTALPQLNILDAYTSQHVNLFSEKYASVSMLIPCEPPEEKI